MAILANRPSALPTEPAGGLSMLEQEELKKQNIDQKLKTSIGGKKLQST